MDTINWMAIDKNEFDISNAINSLANILRYAIVNSNEEVSIKEEIDWLKKYIYLQQFRLKNKFICKVNVAPEIMEYKIHKLLLQPFVENAIVHGFSGMKEQHVLEVILEAEAKLLKIIVRDNGTGIEQTVQDQFNLGVFEKPQEGNHIGVENAITRLQMYYGENGKVRINSVISEGTEIIIYIPIKQ